MSSISLYSNYANQLQQIEKELHAQPITKELREQMIQALDEIHLGLSQMETTAGAVNRFATGFLDELRQKAVFLYGEIDDFFHQHSIEVIRQDAELLKENFGQNHFEKMSRIAQDLKSRLDELLKSYSPGLNERRVLVIAALTLEQAETLLRGSFAQEVILDENCLANAEMIIEEIAEYLGDHDRQGLKQLWSRLSQEERKIVRIYLDPRGGESGFLHDIERPANDDTIFGSF